MPAGSADPAPGPVAAPAGADRPTPGGLGQRPQHMPYQDGFEAPLPHRGSAVPGQEHRVVSGELGPGPLRHRRGQIDAGDGVSLLGGEERPAAGAAAQVEDVARPRGQPGARPAGPRPAHVRVAHAVVGLVAEGCRHRVPVDAGRGRAGAAPTGTLRHGTVTGLPGIRRHCAAIVFHHAPGVTPATDSPAVTAATDTGAAMRNCSGNGSASVRTRNAADPRRRPPCAV